MFFFSIQQFCCGWPGDAPFYDRLCWIIQGCLKVICYGILNVVQSISSCLGKLCTASKESACFKCAKDKGLCPTYEVSLSNQLQNVCSLPSCPQHFLCCRGDETEAVNCCCHYVFCNRCGDPRFEYDDQKKICYWHNSNFLSLLIQLARGLIRCFLLTCYGLIKNTLSCFVSCCIFSAQIIICQCWSDRFCESFTCCCFDCQKMKQQGTDTGSESSDQPSENGIKCACCVFKKSDNSLPNCDTEIFIIPQSLQDRESVLESSAGIQLVQPQSKTAVKEEMSKSVSKKTKKKSSAGVLDRHKREPAFDLVDEKKDGERRKVRHTRKSKRRVSSPKRTSVIAPGSVESEKHEFSDSKVSFKVPVHRQTETRLISDHVDHSKQLDSAFNVDSTNADSDTDEDDGFYSVKQKQSKERLKKLHQTVDFSKGQSVEYKQSDFGRKLTETECSGLSSALSTSLESYSNSGDNSDVSMADKHSSQDSKLKRKIQRKVLQDSQLESSDSLVNSWNCNPRVDSYSASLYAKSDEFPSRKKRNKPGLLKSGGKSKVLTRKKRLLSNGTFDEAKKSDEELVTAFPEVKVRSFDIGKKNNSHVTARESAFTSKQLNLAASLSRPSFNKHSDEDVAQSSSDIDTVSKKKSRRKRRQHHKSDNQYTGNVSGSVKLDRKSPDQQKMNTRMVGKERSVKDTEQSEDDSFGLNKVEKRKVKLVKTMRSTSRPAIESSSDSEEELTVEHLEANSSVKTAGRSGGKTATHR